MIALNGSLWAEALIFVSTGIETQICVLIIFSLTEERQRKSRLILPAIRMGRKYVYMCRDRNEFAGIFVCAEYSIEDIDPVDRGDWQYVIPVGKSPYGIYRQAVIKGDARRERRASLIITVLMNWDCNGEKKKQGIPGLRWSELIDRVVPRGFDHPTSADRVIQGLVNYGVIKRIEKHVTRNQMQTYYSIDDGAAFASAVSPSFVEQVPHRFNEKEHRVIGDTYRLYVQAEAGRRVMERNNLTAEWVAECEKLALEPVITQNMWAAAIDRDDEDSD